MKHSEKEKDGSSHLPSSNWLALQKKLKPSAHTGTASDAHSFPRKKRKTHHENAVGDAPSDPTSEASTSFTRGQQILQASTSTSTSSAIADGVKNGESLGALRRMIAGELSHAAAQKLPGKYLAIDCEMVGVGLEGKESSLARVSIVNYHGAVQMDELVKQRERVVDYRTEWSGIRPTDMVKARPFDEVQKQVAELIKDRILVGHAIHNDMKALLLSHPRHLVRDTQTLAAKHKLTSSKRPALRHLVQQELGTIIQGGEHSSVIDARATMAVFRLHRKTWEQSVPQPPHGSSSSHTKRKRGGEAENGDEDEDAEPDADTQAHAARAPKRKAQAHSRKEPPENPGGGRKGVSSGLSTVIKRRETGGTRTKSAWWKDLGGSGNKGSIKL